MVILSNFLETKKEHTALIIHTDHYLLQAPCIIIPISLKNDHPFVLILPCMLAAVMVSLRLMMLGLTL